MEISNGASRGSVWETRMRIDQVKGGMKVFGVLEQEDEERGRVMYNHREKQEDGEDEEMGAVAGRSPILPKRNGARGGKRRTWKPQPQTFTGPVWEKPERTERSPADVKKSRSESTEGPAGKGFAKSTKGKLELLQKAGEKISNGVISGGSTDISESESMNQSAGPPEKVIMVHSKKKSTATSHDNLHGKPRNHVGHFKTGPNMLGCNHGNDEDTEEFLHVKEISSAEQESKTTFLQENKVRVSLFGEKPVKPITAPVIKQQPSPFPVAKQYTVHQSYAKQSAFGCKHGSQRQNILSSLLDLVMWRDIPKSAICVGLGTFTLITSSYMNDPNMCFISTISHLGLACLAAIFFYRSIIWRGYAQVDDTSFYELGEEEVLCLTKLVLPYLNDLVRKLKALLYGDPATTMKLAVLLFVLARCGSFVSMWNMMKLGFFIAFTIPKLWSLYYIQLADQGKYWVRVSQHMWDSCPHRKAIAAVAIILVLGYSSNFTRIWGGLMLLVALRYYQQSLVRDGSSMSSRRAEERWRGPRRLNIHAFTEL